MPRRKRKKYKQLNPSSVYEHSKTLNGIKIALGITSGAYGTLVYPIMTWDLVSRISKSFQKTTGEAFKYGVGIPATIASFIENESQGIISNIKFYNSLFTSVKSARRLYKEGRWPDKRSFFLNAAKITLILPSYTGAFIVAEAVMKPIENNLGFLPIFVVNFLRYTLPWAAVLSRGNNTVYGSNNTVDEFDLLFTMPLPNKLQKLAAKDLERFLSHSYSEFSEDKIAEMYGELNDDSRDTTHKIQYLLDIAKNHGLLSIPMTPTEKTLRGTASVVGYYGTVMGFPSAKKGAKEMLNAGETVSNLIGGSAVAGTGVVQNDAAARTAANVLQHFRANKSHRHASKCRLTSAILITILTMGGTLEISIENQDEFKPTLLWMSILTVFVLFAFFTNLSYTYRGLGNIEHKWMESNLRFIGGAKRTLPNSKETYRHAWRSNIESLIDDLKDQDPLTAMEWVKSYYPLHLKKADLPADSEEGGPHLSGHGSSRRMGGSSTP